MSILTETTKLKIFEKPVEDNVVVFRR